MSASYATCGEEILSTERRVSTITAISRLNTVINLKSFFELANVVEKDSEPNHIIYIEFGKDKFDCVTRGTHYKPVKKPKNTKKKDAGGACGSSSAGKKGNGGQSCTAKRFDNQITIIIQLTGARYVNMKLFQNGKIQMTGLKAIDEGHVACGVIKREILSARSKQESLRTTITADEAARRANIRKAFADIEKHKETIVAVKSVHIQPHEVVYKEREIAKKVTELNNKISKCNAVLSSTYTAGESIEEEEFDICDKGTIKETDYKVCLINTDFEVNTKIKREHLYGVLVDKQKNLCSYVPEMYPGVKLQYLWNRNRNHNGNCRCYPQENDTFLQKYCVGNGSGTEQFACKKITIAIFQSGRIIITGASFEQIEDAYSYIVRIIKENFDKVHKKQLDPELIQKTIDRHNTANINMQKDIQ